MNSFDTKNGNPLMMVLRILLLLAIAYGGAILWMCIRQESYLFLPCRYDPPDGAERFSWNPAVNGVQLQGWFLDKGAARTVIYYGGNAEDVSGHIEPFFAWLEANVLLVNYRGYGESEGKPGEKELVADALEIYDRLVDEKQIAPENIILMGRSLGSGVAVQVAAARKSAGVILVTPYESIAAIAKFQYPWLPIERVLRHPFRSVDLAPEIKLPLLTLLAQFDEVIPIETGRRLTAAWGGPTETVTLPARHNEINDDPGYFDAINRFVNR